MHLNTFQFFLFYCFLNDIWNLKMGCSLKSPIHGNVFRFFWANTCTDSSVSISLCCAQHTLISSRTLKSHLHLLIRPNGWCIWSTDALPRHIHLPVCLWIMDPHGGAPKKNTSHGNEVLPQDTAYFIQKPCYQQGSLCQDPVGNQTTRRPDHRKEMQTAMLRSCLPFIRSGQNHLAKHSERGKKTRQTEEEEGRQQQGMDRPGVGKVPEGGGEQGKMEETGCDIICGALLILTVTGQVKWCMAGGTETHR